MKWENNQRHAEQTMDYAYDAERFHATFYLFKFYVLAFAFSVKFYIISFINPVFFIIQCVNI